MKTRDLIADYQEYRDAFFRILEPDCPYSILAYEGAAESGKTVLLKRCLVELQGRNVKCARFEFRPSGFDSFDFLIKVARSFEPPQGNHFFDLLSRLRGGDNVNNNIDRNILLGFGNRIVVNPGDPGDDYDQTRSLMTQALFADIASSPHLILVVIDNFDHLPPDSDFFNWFLGPFLSIVLQLRNLKVVLTGEKIPNPKSIELDDEVYYSVHLQGVHDPEDWLKIIRALGKKVPRQPEVTCVGTVIDLMHGQPGAIMAWIEGLPEGS